MHPRQPVPPALDQLAGFQARVVTREQALGLGLSRHALARLTGNGEWTQLARGAYLTAAVEPTWDALAWAGVLLGGQGARLGPRASAFKHGLRPAPETVDVLVPAARPIRIGGPWRFQREGDGVRSPRTVGSPPRLTVEDTVLDLCDEGGPGEVVSLVTTVCQKRLTTTDRLLRALRARSRHRHRKLLLDLLAEVAAGCESALEVHYARDVERAHGLPRGERQRSRLGLPHRTDVEYDGYQLLVELDGRAGHEGEGRFRDMRRDNAFMVARWLTLRYGWFDVVDRPCEVALQVAEALIECGWSGLPTRCPRCERMEWIA